MAILIRKPETDRKIRALAKRWDCTLQEAVDRAVSAVPETAEERTARYMRRPRRFGSASPAIHDACRTASPTRSSRT